MSSKGPIILIDDDQDERFLVQSILHDLNITNPFVYFENGQGALDYLWVTKDKPFIIFCDVNMPGMTGLELRNQIDSTPYLKSKSIPFIFLSSQKDIELIHEAYESTIQGFYKKDHNYDTMKGHLQVIFQYWQSCLHPNNL